MQVHAAMAVLWLGEFEFAAHATQVAVAVAAVMLEYVPAPQLLHAALPLAIL